MKEILGVPTYSLGETIAHDTPEIPKDIYGIEMKDWIEKMGNTSNPEYTQTGAWKSVIGEMRNFINYVLNTTEFHTIHFGMIKIENNLSGNYEDYYY